MRFGTMNTLSYDKQALARFCYRYRIRRLSLFGSVLKRSDHQDSDVDFLVEFYPDAVPGYFRLARIEAELSELLGGRRVDLRTPQELSRYFRDQVLREAEVQFAA
jgi:uncharacterized protein